MQVCKYSSICKYSRISKYASIQVYMQVFKYSRMQVFKNMQVFKHWSMKICMCASLWLCKRKVYLMHISGKSLAYLRQISGKIPPWISKILNLKILNMQTFVLVTFVQLHLKLKLLIKFGHIFKVMFLEPSLTGHTYPGHTGPGNSCPVFRPKSFWSTNLRAKYFWT